MFNKSRSISKEVSEKLLSGNEFENDIESLKLDECWNDPIKITEFLKKIYFEESKYIPIYKFSLILILFLTI